MRFAAQIFETTLSTGTGPYALEGAQPKKRGYADVFADGTPVPYYVEDDAGTFEEGWGVFDTDEGTISRNVKDSTTGALIDWGAGSKRIIIAPAGFFLDSLARGNAGTARPDWLPAGGSWPDTANNLLKYFNGAADVPIIPLVMGSAGQTLHINPGGTAPEWGAGAITRGKHAITVPAFAMYPAVTNGAGEPEQETTTNDVNARPLAFDPATEEYAWLAFIAPKSSDETAGFTVRNLKWAEDGAPSSHGVVWGFSMLARGNGEALDTALGAEVTVADTGAAAGTIYTADESGSITPGGTWAKGDLLFLRVARKVANGSDTLDTDALLYGLELTLTIAAGTDA